MIQKRLAEISECDLDSLVTNSVPEGRTLEYKRELPAGSDESKREFLADVSSFANSGEGDLIFGVEESQGVASGVGGLESTNLDLELNRLENLMASSIEPRIRCAVRGIALLNGRKVIIFRVERSWNGPHRVTFRGHDKFYGRNSAGKYALDVNELRAAFTLPLTSTERLRSFRVDRVIAISNNNAPVPLPEMPQIILHAIPLDAFSSQPNYDLLPYYQNPGQFRPMIQGGGWNRRWNLDGLLTYSGVSPAYAYTQLYRTGIIEAVDGYRLASVHNDRPTIPSIAYERDILAYIPHCLAIQRNLGVRPLIALALTLTRTRGLFMGVDNWGFERGEEITAEMMTLPETIVEDYAAPIEPLMKPIFDLVWNAAGHAGSRNFDEQGNWVARR